MARQKIIVADDDPAVRELVGTTLERDGYTPLTSSDGVSLLRALRDGADLAIIDLGLPVLDGLSVLRIVQREKIEVPVMVLTGRIDEVDRIVAFELGVQDYVTKPFYAREIACRVRAILRRLGRDVLEGPRVLRFGRLEIDEAARVARVDGEPVDLRPREFSLLVALAEQPGVALARRALIERAWGFDYDGDERTIDSHVRRIRMRLEAGNRLPQVVTTIYGFGYKWELKRRDPHASACVTPP